MKTFEERFKYTSSIPKLDKFGEDLNEAAEGLMNEGYAKEDIISILRLISDKYEEEINA